MNGTKNNGTKRRIFAWNAGSKSLGSTQFSFNKHASLNLKLYKQVDDSSQWDDDRWTDFGNTVADSKKKNYFWNVLKYIIP